MQMSNQPKPDAPEAQSPLLANTGFDSKLLVQLKTHSETLVKNIVLFNQITDALETTKK